MWSAAKASNAPVFPGPVVEWDINKVRLVRWTSLYDSVYEHFERPPEYVIQDDIELDKWLDEIHEEREAEIEERWRERKKKPRGGAQAVRGKRTSVEEFVFNSNE